jgi:hypothetical protein
MAQEKLVAPSPPADMIDAGRALLARLDQVKFPVAAALWILRPDSGLWRLVIASPLVGSKGEHSVYEELWSHVNALQSPVLSLANISARDPSDPLITRLTKGFGSGPQVSGIHITGTAIQGVSFPDAYVYRVS